VEIRSRSQKQEQKKTENNKELEYEIGKGKINRRKKRKKTLLSTIRKNLIDHPLPGQIDKKTTDSADQHERNRAIN